MVDRESAVGQTKTKILDNMNYDLTIMSYIDRYGTLSKLV